MVNYRLGIIISLIITKKPWKNKKMDSYVDDEAELDSIEGKEIEA